MADNRVSGSSRASQGLGNGPLTLRNVLGLVAVLLAAKVIVFAVVYEVAHGQIPSNAEIYILRQGLTSTLRTLSTDWDGLQYQLIAQAGYATWKGSESYAFSPVYPALIYAAHYLTGSYWTAALVVTNALSFVFPIILLRLFGFRTALIVETFPVYIVYSMIGYSDALALVFLALALLCYVRGRYLLTGVSVALAGLVLYDLFLALAAFAGYMVVQKVRGKAETAEFARAIISLVLPVVLAGAGVLAAYQMATGDPFTFFKLERAYWAVAATTPLGQIEWVFNGSGAGSFTGITWDVYGVALTSTYWVVRNAAFEAFFLFGIYLLARLKDCPERWLLVCYSLLFSVPLLFVQGTPVYSIPRLLLAAFPVFFGYSGKMFTRNWRVAVYVAASLLAACWVLMTFAYAFFA
jgi:hypothetical protein